MAADVAVIMPARDAVRTIGAALASIAGQTEPPAEVVVVDDGSVDETAAAADRAGARLPLTLIRNGRSEGPAAARARAISTCAAPWIALLDADDVMLPDHLETLGALRAPSTVVVGDGFWWDGSTIDGTFRQRRAMPITDVRRALLRRNFVFIASMFERSSYDAVGGFRDGVTGAEDWDLWLRLAWAGARFEAAGRPTVLYRIAPGGLTGSGRVHQSSLDVLRRAATEAPTGPERRLARAMEHRLRCTTALRGAVRWRSMGQAMDAARHAASWAVTWRR